ncbi:MAG: hypothetical protein WAU81_05645 [Candidatus Aminicenantales bacterium]
MKRLYHKDLTAERWQNFSFCEQMANIGSEVFRAISWRQKNREYSQLALERALELLDLTLETSIRSSSRLKELARLRETLVDYFSFDNDYCSDDKSWRSYFNAFSYAARNPAAKT